MSLTKRQNRIISLIALSTFIASLAIAAIFGVVIFNNYQENQEIKKQTEAQIAENDYIDNLKAHTNEDGTYEVYSDDEVIEYGLDTIIIE